MKTLNAKLINEILDTLESAVDGMWDDTSSEYGSIASRIEALQKDENDYDAEYIVKNFIWFWEDDGISAEDAMETPEFDEAWSRMLKAL